MATSDIEQKLARLRDTPSKNTMRKVRDLVDEWMPNTAETVRSAIDTMIEEDQDYPIIFSGFLGLARATWQ